MNETARERLLWLALCAAVLGVDLSSLVCGPDPEERARQAYECAEQYGQAGTGPTFERGAHGRERRDQVEP